MVEYEIVSNPLSHIVRDSLYKKINLYELSAGAYADEDEKSTFRETDLHSAIGILIGKLTTLEELSLDFEKDYRFLPIEQIEKYERMFYFVRKNCNSDLSYAIEDACKDIENECVTFFNDEEFATELLNWIIFGVAIVSSIILMPFIYRAQQNIIQIIILFLNIDKGDIKKKIEHYESMRKKIDSHFSRIKRFFWNTNFTVDKLDTKGKNEQNINAKESSDHINQNDLNSEPEKNAENENNEKSNEELRATENKDKIMEVTEKRYFINVKENIAVKRIS